MFEIGYKEIYFKSAILPPLCKGRWFFARKTGGIDFGKELTLVQQPDLQLNLKPNIIYNQNACQSLSQLPLTALFTKESLAIRSVRSADLQPNKCNKESLFCGLFELLIYRGKTV